MELNTLQPKRDYKNDYWKDDIITLRETYCYKTYIIYENDLLDVHDFFHLKTYFT